MARSDLGEIRFPLHLPPGKSALVLFGDSGGRVTFEFADDGVPGAMKLALVRGKRLEGSFRVVEGNDQPQPKEGTAKRKGRGPLKWA